MKKIKIFLVFALLFCIAWVSSQKGTSLTEAVEPELKSTGGAIMRAAEAMPEDKYNFTPKDLDIKNSLFEDVRTFAGQIKHLATDNYDMWCAITGDPLPPGIVDVNGPADIKSKQQILEYLRGSFEEGRKAIATLTTENAMTKIEFRGRQLPRLYLTYFALTHSNDHYGQMVVYMRMCGIDPQGRK